MYSVYNGVDRDLPIGNAHIFKKTVHVNVQEITCIDTFTLHIYTIK